MPDKPDGHETTAESVEAKIAAARETKIEIFAPDGSTALKITLEFGLRHAEQGEVARRSTEGGTLGEKEVGRLYSQA